MPAKNPRTAFEAFIDHSRRVAGGITDRPLVATGHRPTPQPHQLTFGPRGEGAPLRSRHGARGVLLQIAHEYHIVAIAEEQRAYEVVTTAYRYRLLDTQGREILAYHWHPISESWATFPHLHLTSRVRPIDLGPSVDPLALAEMHLPTGPVSLADIVRLLIMEFDVAPRRPDWQAILQAAAS